MKQSNTIYLLCGVSGAGKSWVARQLESVRYVPHDDNYTNEKLYDKRLLSPSDIPVVTECPFGERVVKKRLEDQGAKVIPIFVIEHPLVVSTRYYQRENKMLPKGAFTRASTIKDRAKDWKAFAGTSEQVLTYMRDLLK